MNRIKQILQEEAFYILLITITSPFVLIIKGIGFVIQKSRLNEVYFAYFQLDGVKKENIEKSIKFIEQRGKVNTNFWTRFIDRQIKKKLNATKLH